MVTIIYSVASEPNFKEWIATTKVYDKFHESVSINISDISSKIPNIYHESVSFSIQHSGKWPVLTTELTTILFYTG